jgi:hypothetical protein
MTSPTNNTQKLDLRSIREEPEFKTFRPKQKCSNCGKFCITAKLLDTLEKGKASAICAECLTEQFKLSQETKVKKLKSYKVTTYPISEQSTSYSEATHK